jgi:hypothetical protein
MAKNDIKPDWQIGKKTELRNEIMIRLSSGEYSISKLAKEFRHIIKKGPRKGELDHQRVYNAITALRDFYKEDDGFVKQSNNYPDNVKRGRDGKIWCLTKKGILSLIKIQSFNEFFDMIFFIYDKKYKYLKPDISIHDLITEYEIRHDLYRDKINSEINLSVFNDLKNLIFTKESKEIIFLVLKEIGIKKSMSEDQIITKFEKVFGDRDKGFDLCHRKGLIMNIESEKRYYLSIFGFIFLMTSFSLEKEYFKNKFEEEYEKIIRNYQFIFPKISIKQISELDSIHIFKKIFLGMESNEDNELDLNVSRLLVIQSYFEKIEQTKFRQFFDEFRNAFETWSKKQDCNILSFSSEFKMNPLHFFEMYVDDDIPGDNNLIKGIIDLKTGSIEFKIKEMHGANLETIEGEKYDIFVPKNEIVDKYEGLIEKINQLFILEIKQKTTKITEKRILEILSDFDEDEKSILKDKIVKAFKNIHRVLDCKDSLWELYQLSEKIEKIHEFDIPIDQRMQGFYSLEHFDEDKNTKYMRDIMQFQFLVYLNQHDNKTRKKIMKKQETSDWYNNWIKILVDFHNKENMELEILVS